MNICNSLRRVSIAIALSTCAAATAFAGDSGFYLGANIGKAKYDVDNADLTVFPLVVDSKLDESDLAFGLTFGYRIMPYVGVELSLNDFGDLEKSEQGFTSSTLALGGLATTEIGTRGAALAAIGTFPIQKFELFAKLGAMRAETKKRTRLNSLFGTLPNAGVNGVPSGVLNTTSTSTAALYGLGAGYTIGESMFVKLEWTMVPKVAEKGDDVNKDVDVSVISFGFQYRF